MSAIVEGPKIAALSCGKPTYLVVLLHGEGADGKSVIDQALNWAPTLPKADFVAAEAPLPASAGGGQWLDAPEAPDLATALSAAGAALNLFLDGLLAARRLPDSHLALVGFSQGATVALHAALQRRQPIAAVVGFSGALPVNMSVAPASAPPVLLIHGEEDAVVPFDAMTATKARLKAAGVPVKSMRRRGLGHAMDDDGILAAGDFLTAQLVHKPASGETHDHH